MKPETARILEKFGFEITEASLSTGVRKELIAAMILTESSGNPNAAASTTSARGLMQLTRGAAKDMGVSYDDLFIPAINIKAGAGYLARLIKRNDNREVLGVMAYYAGNRTINDNIDTQLDVDAITYAKKIFSALV